MNKDILHTRLKQDTFESSTQKAILSILVTADIIRRRHSTVCSISDITHNQYNILRILKGVYPDGYCRKDIIERMLEKAPDVTRLIDSLVQKGMAERVESAHDKRMSLTKITKKGIEELQTIHPTMKSFADAMSTLFSEQEAELLSELCSRIIAQDTDAEKGVME